ncbi:MAG: hypothetical protein F4123_01885 [Gemmatimonadetes bacterium]|nr:hypothetical protein [Gemmatimonadota bacterium]MYB99466.1 hypothetical protein [Gemmatimonadota bacterium]MYI45139.1 hypothetical protein [Gemmatimonadota bacterium]
MKTISRMRLPLAATAMTLGCADFAMEADRVPSDMEISTHSVLIQKSETAAFDVIVRDQNGEVMPVPSWAPLAWELEDPSVADVSQDGVVTPLKGGESTLKVKLAGLGAAARVRINPDQVALSAPLIYVTQATQTHEGDVALIAGRPALVRVFMVGDETSFYGPSVRIRVLHGGQEVFQQVFPAMRDRTPDEVIEEELDGSVNGVIPASVVQPGARMVVELDPEGLVPLKQGSQTRYPANGSIALEVREPQMFRHIIVPTINAATGNEAIVGWANALTLDHPYLNLLRSLMPVGQTELEIHEPYRTNLNGGAAWLQWLNDMVTLHEREGRRGYYYGATSQPAGGLLGIAYLRVPASVGVSRADVHTHEVGHNMSLPHAPCGNPAGVDPDFPYSGGSIGVWGYDPFRKRLKGPREFVDVMTYCDPVWISDYNFNKATLFRLSGDGGVTLDGEPPPAGDPASEMLVVRGFILNGEVTLEPAFVVTGPPALPEAGGPYRVDGIGVDGQTAFSLSFSPAAMAYGGGGFVYLVPYESEWAETLDRLVLTGPEGTDTVTRTGSPPMAVVTNPATGNIEAIIRDWDGGPLPGEGVSTVTITRGVPTGEGR